MTRPALRRLLIACTVLTVLAGGTMLAYQVALQRLKAAVVQALGPRASLDVLEIGFTQVELRGLRIRAEREGPRPWPAADELRAERVTLRPQLGAVLRGQWRVGSLHVHGAYLSLLRSRDGKLHVLPALQPAGARPNAQAAVAAPLVLIDQVRLHDAEIELYDASVRRTPHRLRLTQVHARVDDLQLPALDRPLALQIEGVLKGVRQDGPVQIEGTMTPATRDAKLQARFKDVDLIPLQPYLLRGGEGALRGGTLDLSLDATVQRNQLHAPGRLVLKKVDLAQHSWTGMAQRALLATMDREGRIELGFTLAGRLDDPSFSLNEDLAAKVAVAMAEKLGVSFGGLAEGMGNVVKGLLGR